MCSKSRATELDPWFGADKWLHFGVSTGLSASGYGLSSLVLEPRWQRATTGAVFSLTLGATKELVDATGSGDASYKDMTYNLAGTALGVGLGLLLDLWLSDEPRVEPVDTALRHSMLRHSMLGHPCWSAGFRF